MDNDQLAFLACSLIFILLQLPAVSYLLWEEIQKPLGSPTSVGHGQGATWVADDVQ
jgi:hypothetical protein